MAGGCAYTFDPEGWAETHEGESPLEETWSCPHEAPGDAEYCLFHLPPEKREAAGITAADVRDAFVECVAAPGRRGKEFVGATFDDLDLEYRVLDAPDRHAVDLRHAEIRGELTLSEGVVNQPLWLEAARIERATATRAEFTDRCSFAGTRFVGELSFLRAEWDDRTTFEGATFEADARFTRSRFDGRVSFARATFEQEGEFKEARFNDDADFEGATVRGRATFAGVEFNGGANVLVDDANFSAAAFEQDVDFEHAHFRAATFAGATFGGAAAFDTVDFERESTFAGATFAGAGTFVRSDFDGDIEFAGAVFRADAVFKEAEFTEDAVFRDARFERDADFAGATFRGGSKLLVDDADFTDAAFEGPANFHIVEFRYGGFEGARFDDDADFEGATFVRGAGFADARFGGSVGFNRAQFDGQSDFSGATFEAATRFDETTFHSDAAFEGITVEGPVSFQGIDFKGGADVAHDDVAFADSHFAERAVFTKGSFRYANFERAHFGSEVTFDDAEFARGSDFPEVAFDGDARFSHARFDGRSDFADAVFGAETTFDETVFDDDVAFERARFEGEATFDGVEFNGGANVMVDDATFEDARFDAGASFASATFRHGRFDDAVLAGDIRFDDATFERGATFDGTELAQEVRFHGVHVVENLQFDGAPLADRSLVDFRDATLAGGTITQPDDGEVFFDLSSATVGAVRLVDHEGPYELFDYFLFRNTDFEGFDFSRHRGYLESNGWKIHRVAVDVSDFGSEAFDATFSPEDLEATYLKAKNGATAIGDNKAASEFYIRELVYRRRQYASILGDATTHTPVERATAAGRWVANCFFSATCGYGERPSKVVLTSFATVGLFAVVFGVLGIDLARENVVGIAVYSIQAFVSLILGTPQTSSPLINLLTALEGFVGAFFIALFVFALTRSLHR